MSFLYSVHLYSSSLHAPFFYYSLPSVPSFPSLQFLPSVVPFPPQPSLSLRLPYAILPLWSFSPQPSFLSFLNPTFNSPALSLLFFNSFSPQPSLSSAVQPLCHPFPQSSFTSSSIPLDFTFTVKYVVLYSTGFILPSAPNFPSLSSSCL
jgi:hypothetical protein